MRGGLRAMADEPRRDFCFVEQLGFVDGAFREAREGIERAHCGETPDHNAIGRPLDLCTSMALNICSLWVFCGKQCQDNPGCPNSPQLSHLAAG